MGRLIIRDTFDQAAEILGIVAEYIDVTSSDLPLTVEIEYWIAENLEGMVICIFEREYRKMFITFLFQYEEDAVAFKLAWL